MSIFSQPFPRESSTARKVVSSLMAGLVVALFLRFFQPFGFGHAGVQNLNLFAAGYGLVTVVVMLFFVLIESVFPKLFEEERWTVGKNILMYVIIVFVIGAANLYYTALTTGMRITAERFFAFQMFTLSITFVVVSMLTMMTYFRSLSFFRKDAVVMEKQVQEMKPAIGGDGLILESDGGKEKLELEKDALYYISAADNYSRVVFRKKDEVGSVLMRGSLKMMEEQLKRAEVIRCHRSYIVNLRKVSRVSGNSQGYRLHFEGLEETVPVSRSAGDLVHQRLAELSS